MSTSFNRQYLLLLDEIRAEGHIEKNERTGVRIKALAGSRFLSIDLNNSVLPIPGNRRYYPRVAAAEVAWQFLGTKNPEFIMKYAPKMWSKFIEDDELKAAYGYRWRSHFGRDQLASAINALRKDSTNRQVFISAWDPATDGLGSKGPMNIPCPVGFTLNVVDSKLHCSVFIRSSDVFVGLPYDMMGYALTVDAIAASLELQPGTLNITLAHAHIYEPHWTALNMCTEGSQASQWSVSQGCLMPMWSVLDIATSPDDYVAYVAELACSGHQNHPWDPKPEVVV